MFTKIIQDFKYNGLGFSTSKIPESKQQKVEIIGVMKPVDPGFVTVKLSNNEWKQVPTLVLEKCPNIDFEEMLTREQMKRREKFGALLGTGVDEARVLVELKDCPLRKQAKHGASRSHSPPLCQHGAGDTKGQICR